MDRKELIASLLVKEEHHKAEREYKDWVRNENEKVVASELNIGNKEQPAKHKSIWRQVSEELGHPADKQEYMRIYMKKYRSREEYNAYQRDYQRKWRKTHKKSIKRFGSRDIAKQLGIVLNSNWQVHHIFGNDVIDSFVVLYTLNHKKLHNVFGKGNPTTEAESAKQLEWVKANCKTYFVVRDGKLVNPNENENKHDLF